MHTNQFRFALTTLLAMGLMAQACGDPSAAPPEDARDTGEDCVGAGCEGPEDVPTVTPEPEMSPEMMVIERLDCPEETSVEIDGECVPDAFLGQNGEALSPCPLAARSPSSTAETPGCTQGCRGPETPFGMQWGGEVGEGAHAPVTGVVLEVVSAAAARPEGATSETEGCFESLNGQVCCQLEAAAGNRVVVRDRRLRVWTVSHLAPESLLVEVGQVVQAGARIGAFGDSGYTCDEGARVHVSVTDATGLLLDASACIEGTGGEVEAQGECLDMDGDTFGTGPGCLTQDCDDTDASLQAFSPDQDGCMGGSGSDQQCTDRDGDGHFAGAQCPWPDEDCDDFDSQTQQGCQATECICFEGDCCDGCQYLPETQTCRQDQRVEYLCAEGEACGSDVFARFQDIHCSGDSAQCSGAVVWREPELLAACSPEKRCAQNNATCFADEACAQSCETDSDCAQGQYCTLGSCVGDVCPQGEVFCSSSLLRQCSDNGNNFETIERCPFGCLDQACRPCPDNDCSRQDLGEGFHCLDTTRISCFEFDGCLFEFDRELCTAPTDQCSGGRCVTCGSDLDCSSPLHACEEGECSCQHSCEDGEQGCQEPGLRWRCETDEEGCRRRFLLPCDDQEICEEGFCVGFCPRNFCQDNEIDEGRACDGSSRVVCATEGDCAVELERERCRGEARLCDEGDCVDCVEDEECPSTLQSCLDRACVCENTCELGELGCVVSDQRFSCAEDAAGCRYQEVEECGPNEVCQDGECELDCPTNFCTLDPQQEGDFCDGDLRVECHLRANCLSERSWQRCSCGCSEGQCLPCEATDGPYLIIGLGHTFVPAEDGDLAEIDDGFQGGYHIYGALRAFNVVESRSTNQTWRITDGDEEIAFWSVVRNLTAVEDHHEHLGETVQFYFGTRPEELDGLEVTLEVTVRTQDNEILHDEVDIVLSLP